MNNAELAAKILKTKGPLYAPIHGSSDVLYVSIVKKDLVEVLMSSPNDKAQFQIELRSFNYYLEAIN